MNKILVIGQGLPAKPQQIPYDTTMFYDWLAEIGISKDQAQTLFVFTSISPVFTGRNNTNSGHKRPFKKEITQHWPVVEGLLQGADKVLLLGAVAAECYDKAPRTWSCNMVELYLLHPSRRNIFKFRQDKEKILTSLKDFIFKS